MILSIIKGLELAGIILFYFMAYIFIGLFKGCVWLRTKLAVSER